MLASFRITYRPPRSLRKPIVISGFMFPVSGSRYFSAKHFGTFGGWKLQVWRDHSFRIHSPHIPCPTLLWAILHHHKPRRILPWGMGCAYNYKMSFVLRKGCIPHGDCTANYALNPDVEVYMPLQVQVINITSYLAPGLPNSGCPSAFRGFFSPCLVRVSVQKPTSHGSHWKVRLYGILERIPEPMMARLGYKSLHIQAESSSCGIGRLHSFRASRYSNRASLFISCIFVIWLEIERESES